MMQRAAFEALESTIESKMETSMQKSAKKMASLGWLAAAVSVALMGCNPADQPDTSAPVEVSEQDSERIAQQLGEGAKPLWASGVGTGLQPDYRARMLGFMYNRFRIAPHLYGLTYENPPMSGMQVPFIPVPPARLDPYMAEPGRWLAQFRENTGCLCDAAAVNYNPMDPELAENEKFINATCCEMDVVGGSAQCVGPLVPCDNPNATLRTTRWGRLNLGAGQIQTEGINRGDIIEESEEPAVAEFLTLLGASLGVVDDVSGRQFLTAGLSTGSKVSGSAVGVSFIETFDVPDACQEREDPCPGGGVCKDPDSMAELCDKEANAECLGLCDGGDDDGRPCVLPEEMEGPDMCDPENYPTRETLVLAQGQTQAPTPVLSDGIHGMFGNEPPMGIDFQTPEGVVFYPAPEGATSFVVHYYELDGEPAGTPSLIDVVIDDTCQSMTLYDAPDTLPVTNEPAPISGDLYAYDEVLTEGCYGYVFVAQDGAGFEHTFPTYGSLQAKIGADGQVLFNDDACPIWVPQRQNLSCVSSPQECEAGDTRPCYTGLYGTQDQGVCTVGEETCSNGRWSGSCDGEVTPEAEDVCGDGKDNDCDGGVDEGCDTPGEDMGSGSPDMGSGEEDMGAGEADMGGEDMGAGEADMGGGANDMGSTPANPDMGGGDDDDTGCCSQVNHGTVPHHWMVMFIGLFAALMRRRRRGDL